MMFHVRLPAGKQSRTEYCAACILTMRIGSEIPACSQYHAGNAMATAACGFAGIGDIRKSTIEGIVNIDSLDRDHIIYPSFIPEKCVGCQRCYLSCRDGGHQAIEIRDGRPLLNPDKCVGCHLCILVCPREAIASSEIPVLKKN